MGHVTLTTPLSGMIRDPWARDLLRSTCLPNLKSKPPISVHHEDMKRDTKWQFGWFGVVMGHPSSENSAIR